MFSVVELIVDDEIVDVLITFGMAVVNFVGSDDASKGSTVVVNVELTISVNRMVIPLILPNKAQISEYKFKRLRIMMRASWSRSCILGW